ncbi:MAG: hypothetical protein SGI90_13035 [Candidatus Eisenbacteria bacterium]|nr:hypothetical protein [Candidatus Eisenbacteria bacterium]
MLKKILIGVAGEGGHEARVCEANEVHGNLCDHPRGYPSEFSSTNGAQMTDRSLTPAPAAHGAMFTSSFSVPITGDPDYDVDNCLDLVCGDYDVIPASIDVDGTIVPLTTQGGGEDGLVQKASATVPWASMTDGQVVIRVIAPSESYLAFDYALLYSCPDVTPVQPVTWGALKFRRR